MPRENQRQKLLGRRAALLAGSQALMISALAGRLYQLQIFEKDHYRVMADENRINLRLLVPPRGRDPRSLRSQSRRQPPKLSRRHRPRADRQYRDDARRAGDSDRGQRHGSAPGDARREAEALLRSRRGARQSLLGGDGAHRGRDTRTAGRVDRAGAAALLPARVDRGAYSGLCRGGVGQRADRRPVARTSGFPHR